MQEKVTECHKMQKSQGLGYLIKSGRGAKSVMGYFVRTGEDEKTGMDYRVSVRGEKICGMEYAVESPDQTRTRIKKALFLEMWEVTRGVIIATCDKIGIDRRTYYRWRDDDASFRDALADVEKTRNKEVEDILMGKIMIEHDPSCVKYYLDRKHPEYKPRMVQEVIAGERTLEDLIDEDNQKDEDKAPTDRGVDQDPEQKKFNCADEVQSGSGVLLENEEAPQSDLKG